MNEETLRAFELLKKYGWKLSFGTDDEILIYKNFDDKLINIIINPTDDENMDLIAYSCIYKDKNYNKDKLIFLNDNE